MLVIICIIEKPKGILNDYLASNTIQKVHLLVGNSYIYIYTIFKQKKINNSILDIYCSSASELIHYIVLYKYKYHKLYT